MNLNELIGDKKILGLLEDFSDFIVIPRENDTLPYLYKCNTEVEIIAKSGSGSCYVRNINDGKISYISSEGQVVYVAENTCKLLELVIQYPYWLDMIMLSSNVSTDSYSSMHIELKNERLADIPDYIELQNVLIKRFNVPNSESVLDDFISAVKSGTSLNVLSSVDENEYEKLT